MKKRRTVADVQYERFAALIVRAIQRARRRGYVVAQEYDNTCLCPNGAVVLLAYPLLRKHHDGIHYSHRKFEQNYPTCDDAADAYRILLGGDSRKGAWLDEARALEVGFDGSNPDKECVPRDDPYFLLGRKYRRQTTASGRQ